MNLIYKILKRCLNHLPFLILSYCLLWEPDYIKARTSLPDDLFDAGALLLLIGLLVFYLADFRQMFNAFDLSLLLLGVMLLGSTLLHQGGAAGVWKCLKYIYPITGIVLLIDLSVRENAVRTALAFYIMCYANIFLNAVSMILFPGGIYPGHETIPEPQYWLGNENVFIITILAGLGAGFVTVCARGRRLTWDYFFYILLCVFCASWSVTAIIGLGIFLLLWVLQFFIKTDRLFDPLIYEGLGMAAFFGIVFFQLQQYLSFIIVNIFHKDVTLTFRTRLWQRVLTQFRLSPWTGYGIRSGIAFSDSVGGKRHWVHAHNYVLDLLNKGGLAALIPFVAAMIIAALRMRPFLSRSCVRVLSIILLAYMIVFIGDCFEMRTPFFGILALCANAAYLPADPT